VVTDSLFPFFKSVFHSKQYVLEYSLCSINYLREKQLSKNEKYIRTFSVKQFKVILGAKYVSSSFQKIAYVNNYAP